MKKLYIGIVFGVFFLASFMALNLVTSTSFPGYGGNKECNYCHNQPALVKDVSGANATFTMGNIAQAQKVFDENNVQWARDEVPTIQTNNRNAEIAFVSMTFIRNSTDLMVQATVNDNTVNNTSPATSDKFGIIFDIDVVNFSVGQFLTAYTTGQPLSTTLSGQMGFSQGGHADFWFVDTSVVKANTTGMANDEYISTGILTDSQQDVHVMVWYGNGGHGMQYQYYFVRPLNTGDKNDAQFDVAGTPIYYAIAHWDASLTVYHDSSFDQMVVVGNSVSGITARTTTETNVQTETKTETTTTTVSGTTTTTGTTSSFTAVFVLAGLVVSIPLISHMRRRKH
jgi:hypothetical protein